MRINSFLNKYSVRSTDVDSLTNIRKDFRLTRIFYVSGGSEATRTYVLRLLERVFEYPSKEVFFLSEFEDSLWKFLSPAPLDLRVVFWEKNSLKKEEIIEFLKNVYTLEGRTVFIDPDKQLMDIHSETDDKNVPVNFPRYVGRRVICCDFPMKSTIVEDYYEKWLHRIEKVNPSERLVHHMKTRPLLESFNLINTMRYTGEGELTLLSSNKYGLLWSDRERYLVDVLLYKGRGVFKKEDWLDIDSGRFLWMLFREIHNLLKVKTVSQGYAVEKATKIGISPELYGAMQYKAKKVDLVRLFRRLNLVTNLLQWRQHASSVSLLLLYW